MRNRSFFEVFGSSFNQCFFIGLLLLSSYGGLLTDMSGAISLHMHLLLPLANGLFAAIAIFLLNSFFERKKYFAVYSRSNLKSLLLTAFIAGAAGVYLAISAIGTYVITIFIVYLTLKGIKSFSKKMGSLLQVGKIADVQDLVEFFDFFVNLILTFAVINLSIYVANYSLGIPLGFNFGKGTSTIFDSLYFTIVTMTTVGFGDITAQSELAKVVVVMECLTSYVMFGLMIGIISRGVDFNKK